MRGVRATNSLTGFIHKAVRIKSPLCQVSFACDSNWEVMSLSISQLTRPSLLYSPPLVLLRRENGRAACLKQLQQELVWLGLALIYDTSAAFMGWEGDCLATRRTFLSRSVSQQMLPVFQAEPLSKGIKGRSKLLIAEHPCHCYSGLQFQSSIKIY